MIACLPDDEVLRLAILHEHRILDTSPEEQFDDIVALASQICETPIAAVSLIDEEREWFKAITGLDAAEVPRDIAFCAHTILQSELMVVADARADVRFADNPLVTGEPHLRFYAGMPLVTEDGHALGSLCVLDRRPRTLSPKQEEMLRLLARQVSSHLEAARRIAEREQFALEKECLIADKERLIATIASSEEAIIAGTLEGLIVSWNAAAERLYGYTHAEMIGQHFSVLAQPEERQIGRAIIDHLLRGESVDPRETVRTRKDGATIYVSLSFSPIRNAAGQMIGVSCISRDITERKKTEIALAESAAHLLESEAGLRALLESAPVILYATDAAGKITLSEGTGLAALGLRPGEAVGHSILEFSEGNAKNAEYTRRAMAGEAVSFDAQVGNLFLHTELSPTWGPDGALTGMIGVCFDVTERTLAEERFRLLFEASSDAHLLVGEDGIIDCNDAAVTLLGCADKAQLISLHPAVMSPEYQPDGRLSREKKSEMDALAYKHGFHRFEWTLQKTDGEEFPVEVSLTPVKLENHSALLSVLHDLTERKRAEDLIKKHALLLELQKGALELANAELAALATTDGLTGLHNHRAFQERLTEEIARATRHKTPLSLILLDVDSFKQYNDTHGHPAGDAVLQAVARLLQECTRDTDLTARYGGEEFVLLLPQTDVYGATVVAERVQVALEEHPWPLRSITASLGVTALRMGGENSAEMIARADAALYASKAAGRNRVTIAPDRRLVA